MARVGINGALSGLMGDAVFRNFNGQTYLSARPDKVNNPRTENQQTQRLKLRNIINIYGAMKDALKDNFQAKAPRQSDYTRFQACNLSRPAVYMTMHEGDWNRGSVVAPYIVSFGTLPAIEYHIEDGWMVSNLKVSTLMLNPDTSILDLTSAITTENEDWKKGDTLEIITCTQKVMTGNEPNTYPYTQCSHANIHLTNDFKKPLASLLNGIEIKVNEDGCLCVKIPSEGGAALVRKRGEGRDTMTSVQLLEICNPTFDTYHSEERKQLAIASYAKKK